MLHIKRGILRRYRCRCWCSRMMLERHQQLESGGDNVAMNKTDPTIVPAPQAGAIQSQFSMRRFILTGQFLPSLFFSAIGVAILVVIGSIAIKAVKNHGLIPPPNTLDRYECTGSSAPFSLYYLHGTERVKIKSQMGLLEGTLSQNQFDWVGFSGDPALLGFPLPNEITFENATSLRIKSPGSSEISCLSTVDVSDRRRGTIW